MPFLNYRVFQWTSIGDLRFIGDYDEDDLCTPGEKIEVGVDDDKYETFIVSEIHYPNPRLIKRSNGNIFCPDSIIIVNLK